MAVLNLKKAKEIYPGWIVQIYVDRTYRMEWIRNLKSLGAEIIVVTDPSLTEGKIRGMFWRFLVFEIDPDAELMLVRDVDSLLSWRERWAVDEWLNSTKGFHSMRDSPYHNIPVMGGMWGARRGALPKLYDSIKSVIKTSFHGGDQYFLRIHVWPHVMNNSMQHDAFHCVQFKAKPFPKPRKHRFFVGGVCNPAGECQGLGKEDRSPYPCRPTPSAESG